MKCPKCGATMHKCGRIGLAIIYCCPKCHEEIVYTGLKEG